MMAAEQVAQQILDELDLGEGLREGTPKTAHDLTSAMQSGWIEGDTVMNMLESAAQLAIQADHTVDVAPDGWDNSIPREMADCLRDRETTSSTRAAKWLKKHESDDEVWEIIGSALDQIEKLALFDIEMKKKKKS